MLQQVPLSAANNQQANNHHVQDNNHHNQQQPDTEREKPSQTVKANDKTSSTTSALQQQINGINSSNNSSNDVTNDTTNNNNIKTTKLNGLKNRIIQRPPPLILDKVSNFYDNDSQSHLSHPSTNSTNQQQQQQPVKASNCLNLNETDQSNKHANQNQNNGTNSANHKFWASLNQNASRTRSIVGTRATDSTTKDSSDPKNLGADLIITHRNSGSMIASHRPSNASSLNQKPPPPSPLRHQQQTTKGSFNTKTMNEEPSINSIDPPAATTVSTTTTTTTTITTTTTATTTTKPLDMSNNSELDDSSTHGGVASENDGGNLIGVDNPTPPASTLASDRDSHQTDEPPVSATSSRPRSNNPFLVTDDELLSTLETENNNFLNKRPPSFIAATDSTLMSDHYRHHHNHQQQQQQQQQQVYNHNNISGTQQIVQEQFNNMHMEDQNRQSYLLQHVQQENPYCSERDIILVDHQVTQDQRDTGTMYDPSMMTQQQSHQQRHLQQQPIYRVYSHNGSSYINYEPTISVDSESTVCRPPPTMQLSHWTDAIYELNNAILETSSVAGGAENGKFIYIIENGDIILELDHIKVSGFTLVEFNELVESKPIHLLNGVQTKHSHGLSTDLKHYLSCSFPKNSADKQLQDLIRENIYRRTIPCTSRQPKEGEVDKVDYHFLSKEQFVEMNNRGMLLECGMFGGHYYGTMRPFSDINSLSIYGSMFNQKEMSKDMQQPLNASHPAIGLTPRKESSIIPINQGENPFYENHESLKMHQMQITNNQTRSKSNVEDIRNQNSKSGGNQIGQRIFSHIDNFVVPDMNKQSSIVAIDSESLPHGWERVIDQTHGTYYIDHNTQRTQYERPYEIQLTKGVMGFGFTLVEAENGVLLVRSIIPGGPAYLNGAIRPGDILISAVGVSVTGLQHTDIARIFSTFSVGDRIRLTFARSSYVVDENLVPDEYLFSNGTNGDLAVAVNSNYLNCFNQNMVSQSPNILVNQEFEFLTLTLKRGDQGFGFTISDSFAGQKVRKIQNNETCTNLRQGDILINLDGQDITKLTHKEVVERLKNCPAGRDVTLTIKRKKRFRSKTPIAMHTENEDYSLDSTPQRNCKTPNIDNLMLRRSTTNPNESVSRTLFSNQQHTQQIPSIAFNGANHLSSGLPQIMERSIIEHNLAGNNYYTMPNSHIDSQSIYGINPMMNNELYYDQQSQQHLSLPTNFQLNTLDHHRMALRPSSILSTSDGILMADNMTNSVNNISDTSLPPMKFSNVSHINKYNNFMNNDKLVMMQMQQQKYQNMLQQNPPQVPPPQPICDIQTSSVYHQMPLYSNSDMLKAEAAKSPIPTKPTVTSQYIPDTSYNSNFQNNYYANNEEIALQRVQYGCFSEGMLSRSDLSKHSSFIHQSNYSAQIQDEQQQQHDEYEYHQIDLDRGNKDSNWGIRLIGGSEVDRAISIGSIVFGGVASKNGRLKSGDEIISINGINVVGATHQHVVELISACSNRASLVVRRKKFAEACEVVLTKNMDEGFGFVIISSGNCALIGRIIEGSPADRCQQLHVRDRIIAVNGRYITPNMQHPEIVNMIKECGSTLRLRIIPADCYTVELIKSAQNDNFGFSMRGGSEYDGTPLYILRVAPNGLARDLLNVGDQIIEINSIPTVGMTHQQAATIIKYSDPIVKLKLRRNYVTPPSLLVDSPRALQKFNQVTAEMKTVNQNTTPNHLQDGSASSEISSSIQQHSSLIVDHQQQGSQQQAGNNSLVYSQSMPLYAT